MKQEKIRAEIRNITSKWDASLRLALLDSGLFDAISCVGINNPDKLQNILKSLKKFAKNVGTPPVPNPPEPPDPETVPVSLSEALALGGEFNRNNYGLQAFSFEGKTVNVKKFADAFVEILRKIFQTHSAQATRVVEVITTRSFYFSKSSQGFLHDSASVEEIIPRTLYVNTTSNNPQKMKDLKFVFEEFSLPLDSLTFLVAKK